MTQLPFDPAFDDAQPRDFSAHAAPHARPEKQPRPAQRKLIRRRIGVLAAAIAVPAMAAPSIQPAREVQVIRFAIPETIPYTPNRFVPETAPISETAEALPAISAPAFSGPAAQPFSLSGSYANRSRAEQCLAMAIYYEAASESTNGQRAVAQVVLNRVRNGSFPNTICGVVFEGSQRSTGCQFSFTCDGSMARTPSRAAWNRAERVAHAALGGFVFEPVSLATHYHTVQINPYWAPSLNPVGTIGAHRFYRWRGAAGQSAAFSANYGGNEPGIAAHPTRPTAQRARASARTTGEASQAVPITAPTTVSPQNAPAPVTASPSDNLPTSGSVREEYAQSGRWLVDL